MVVLGILLLVLGWLTGVSIVPTIGIVLIVVGVVLFALAAGGRPVGGRNWW